jgi:hypothetical protein
MKELRLKAHLPVGVPILRLTLAVRDARLQLARRMKLVDVILHIGFGRKGVYFARIFVPGVATTQSTQLERYRIKFTRTDIPQRIPFLGTDNHQVISMEGDRLFSPSQPQIYTEYDTILLRLETPMKTQ